MLAKNLKSVTSVLPKGMDEKRFCRMAINAVMKNPTLADCNPESFVMSVVNAGEMGLELGLGHAALIPYNGIVQCQVMFQGLIELARRSGEILTITAEVVREGDVFDYGLGLDPYITHKQVAEEGAELTHVYAVAKLKNGEKQFEIMTKKDVMKIKASSKASAKPGSPWNTWPSEMWKKSAIKRLCKLLPKSVQLLRALDIDDAFDGGRVQTPSMAEIDPALIDISAAVGAPQGDGEIKQPKATKEKAPKAPVEDKKPKKGAGKLAKGQVSTDTVPAAKEPVAGNTSDHQALAEECMALEKNLSSQAVQKAKQMVGIDEAADPLFLSSDELVSLLTLYKTNEE